MGNMKMAREVVRKLDRSDWIGLTILAVLFLVAFWLTHVMYVNRGIGTDLRAGVTDLRGRVKAIELRLSDYGS